MDNLATASLIALILRVASTLLFMVVLIQQFRQFSIKALYKGETRLKILLFHLVIFIMLSQIPIMFLHINRITSESAGSPVLTSFATVANAASLLVVSALLYLIYKESKGDKL